LELNHLALKVLESYDDFVIACSQDHEAAPGDLTGASIYVPGSGPADSAYSGLSLSSLHWDELCSAIRTEKEDATIDADLTVESIDADLDDLPDTVSLIWSSSYEYSEAWIFINTPQGLHLNEEIQSLSNTVTVSDLGGDLVISVSAGNDDLEAVAYAEIGVTLFKPVSIAVYLTVNGASAADRYEVLGVTATGEHELSSADGIHKVTLESPTDIVWGEMVTIVVSEIGEEDSVKTCMAVYLGDDINMDIDLTAHDAEQDLTPLYICATILAAVALVLLRRKRGPRKTQGPRSETFLEEEL
jgi:hypothetical protein